MILLQGNIWNILIIVFQLFIGRFVKKWVIIALFIETKRVIDAFIGVDFVLVCFTHRISANAEGWGQSAQLVPFWYAGWIEHNLNSTKNWSLERIRRIVKKIFLILSNEILSFVFCLFKNGNNVLFKNAFFFVIGRIIRFNIH